MFFSRKRAKAEPECGSRHVRTISGRAIEKAEVIEVAVDGMGIPHVHYRLTHLHSSRESSGELRVLALSCFLEQFRRLDQAA
ncbi:hypothetical protein [Minwuia sp.]|uniref:hypothetical protein n=1 Tax=Minwuia sp. TaxID=2493630 RepID=UPI003A93B9FF